MTTGKAFVTLVLNDAYCIGALVLAHSIRKTHTQHEIVCMVGINVSFEKRLQLEDVFDAVIDVPTLSSGDAERLRLLGRPELGPTLTKIYAWRLTQFTKCVFLDADTLVLSNVDDLFERPAFAAAPDIGWPDCFNSGVFVFQPSLATFEALLSLSSETGSFDGGDQGLLNEFFSTWPVESPEHRLPFTDNLTANVAYGYAPAFKRYGDRTRIVHFIGKAKPWHGSSSSSAFGLHKFTKLWWDTHDDLQSHLSYSSGYTLSSAPRTGGISANQTFVSHSDAHIPAHDPSTRFMFSSSADEICARIHGLSFTPMIKTPTRHSRSSSVGSSTGASPVTSAGRGIQVMPGSSSFQSTSVPASNIQTPGSTTFPAKRTHQPPQQQQQQQQKGSANKNAAVSSQGQPIQRQYVKQKSRPGPVPNAADTDSVHKKVGGPPPPSSSYSPHKVVSGSPTRLSFTRSRENSRKELLTQQATAVAEVLSTPISANNDVSSSSSNGNGNGNGSGNDHSTQQSSSSSSAVPSITSSPRKRKSKTRTIFEL